MSSPLKNSMSASTTASSITRPTSQSPPPTPPARRTITQTYLTASTARTKLMKEASRADHNLHRLVGHANLLDHLMLDLASAEEEQEAAYNNSYTVPARAPAPAPQSKQHIIWADTVVEEEREEDDVYDAGSDNEETSQVFDDDEEEDLTLTRTPSHSVPGLSHEDESEDDSEPESEELEDEREIPLDAYSEKQRQAITTTSFFSQRRSTLASKTAVSLLEEESWRQIAVAAC